MALTNSLDLLEKAKQGGYAVPAFNVHNLETVQAVAETAYEEQSPVIIQTTPGTLKHAGAGFLAALVKTAGELFPIPMVLHLDHCESLSTIVECIRWGYTSVMIDGSRLPYQQNVALVREVVQAAHAGQVSVEAELGRIGGTEDELSVSASQQAFTDPEEARDFVEETDIDSLAVAIGTAHGVYQGNPHLDFRRLEAIAKLVAVPLVLHGASGVPDEDIQRAIGLGITKVNIATELKIPMAQAIQKVFARNPQENDPRHYMGRAKEAVKRVVRQKIFLCGSGGRAREFM